MIPIIFFIFGVSLTNAQNEICCEHSGNCFTDDPPFDRANWPLPQCIIPRYILYRKDLEEPVEITRDNTPPEYNPVDDTVFITHGWRDWNSGWMDRAKDEFLENPTVYNVIIVEWLNESFSNYTQATSNSRSVGADIADMQRQLQPNYLWCVGHSLGGHACGHAGKYDASIDRITGLDLTGPNYDLPQCNEQPEVCRLHPSDARFVDGIHTDAQGAGAGTYSLVAHSDFFPNGGVAVQPGCENSTEVLELCSHSQAIEFFIASINNDCFVVTQNCTDQYDLPNSCGECNDGGCPNMGASATFATGIFYLETGPEYPFCLDN